MLDTVILSIPLGKFSILEDNNFSPNAKLIFEKYSSVRKAVYRSKDWKFDYMPHLTLFRSFTRQGVQIGLRIEFSASKLLFGNNLDELEEEDFEKLICTLKNKLKIAGVLVKLENLRTASILAFHVSKNISLFGGYTATGIIEEIRKISLTKRLDLTKVDFQNDGQSIQLYANSYSLVIYDKVSDLLKPLKRAIDKENTALNADLAKRIYKIRKEKRLLEILRIEARLCRKSKLNQVLTQLGFDKNPVFKDIFDLNLWRKVLSYFWSKLIDNNNQFVLTLRDDFEDPGQLLEKLSRQTNLRPTKQIFLVGLALLVKRRGVRWLRKMLESNNGGGGWRRTAESLQILNDLVGEFAQQEEIFQQIKIDLLSGIILKKEKIFEKYAKTC